MRPSKRLSGTRAHDRRTFSLMVHGPEFGAGEELVINPECFPDVKVNDLVEISQPERDHHRLILQVTSLNPVRGKLQISILKDIAAQFGLDAFYNVVVQKIEPRDVTVDYMELTFKDQFVSRADIWRVKVAMYGKCVYVGKHVATLGVRSQVEALLSSNQNVMCGVVGADTKLIVRSRSSRLIWLVQMSTEMWEFAPDGELYYEKLLNRLLKVLISKWTECSVSHSVTIIAFSRSYYDKDQFPDNYDPTSSLFKEPLHQGFGPGCGTANAGFGYGPSIHIDADSGRYYEDFYKVLVMNYTGPDWNHLLGILKKEFVHYHRTHRWRTPGHFMPVQYEVLHSQHAEANPDSSSSSHAYIDLSNSSNAVTLSGARVVWKSLPFGVPSRAIDGNILEAINVTLNIFDKHYMDRDLNRTGQSVVMLTAGSGVFRVDEHLVEVTKQRMMDNGVGMDMIALATPPMHVVPLFICRTSEKNINGEHIDQGKHISTIRSPNSTVDTPTYSVQDLNDFSSSRNKPKMFYIVPHWVNITFLEFDCKCASQVESSIQGLARHANKKLFSHRMCSCECEAKFTQKFAPLPPFRMFDWASPSVNITFPVALSNMMKIYPVDDKTHDVSATSTAYEDCKAAKLCDSLSSCFPAVGADRWQLCKSPDYVTRPPRLHSYTSSPGLGTSLLEREAFDQYDADVFSPMLWKVNNITERRSTGHFFEGVVPSPFDEEDGDCTSATLTGDMLNLLNNQSSSRWKSVSSHPIPGASSSLVHSILSPRNSITHSRSASQVREILPIVSPSSGITTNKSVSINAKLFGSSTTLDGTIKASSVHEVDHSSSTKVLAHTHSLMKTPPLAPSSRGLRRTPTAPSSNLSSTYATAESEARIRPRALTSREEQEEHAHKATHEQSSPTRSSRSLKLSERSIRSPPLPSNAPMLPSPMELSGSYPKSFLTGNGIRPSMRRSDSDQTSLTPVVGSLHPQQMSDHGASSFHYSRLNEINPFKYSNETLESAAARLTSDRRRWSHLFPTLNHGSGGDVQNAHQDDKQTLLGPNWKSLTSPAVLPLTTDYYPTPKELYTSYTESFYALTLPSTDGDQFPKYKSHDELLIEMVCQRLASDFQLVAKEAGADVDTGRQLAPVGSTNRGPSGESRDSRGNTTTYHLSMGHRIHQIIYDAELQTIEVKRYVERTSHGQHNEPVVYNYSLWVERTESFHPLQQNFYQYPMPESNWNSLDHLLCGYHDEMSDMVKYRRIRFAVLPPANAISGSKAEKEAYASRFTKLVDYLQTRVASEHGAQEKIAIKVSLETPLSPSIRQQVGSMSYKMSCESMATYVRLKREDARNEWLMMHVEDTMCVDKSYHFDVRWLACSGIIVDDFISTIRRKAKQAGLELRRIPEYTSVSFLQIHPLIAPIFLPMPLAIMENSKEETSLVSVMVNRLDFVFDEERLADTKGIGYGLGLGREEPVYVGTRSQRRALSREEREAALLEKWRMRGYKQYIHRHAPVFVRLIRNGLVWIPSYDYEQRSTPQQVQNLFMEIFKMIQDNTTKRSHDATCCSTSFTGADCSDAQ